MIGVINKSITIPFIGLHYSEKQVFIELALFSLFCKENKVSEKVGNERRYRLRIEVIKS